MGPDEPTSEPEVHYCPTCGNGPLTSVSAAQACAADDDAEDRLVYRRHGRNRS